MKKFIIPLSISIILFAFIFPATAKKPTEKATICSSLILAHPIKNGHSWTLASRLGELIHMAEKEYGERDKSWTILGIEFTDQGQPQNWHPFYENSQKNIIIQLTERAAIEEKEALFQLSHEAFHTLSPIEGKDASFFVEGLATYFSLKATQALGIDITPSYISTPQYREAYELIKALYKAHPDAGKRVAKMRKMGIQPSSLTKKQLLRHFPSIDEKTAQELTKKF